MGYEDPKIQRSKEIRQNVPYCCGEWNHKFLYEYLVEVNCAPLDYYVLNYFKSYSDDKELARILLQDFLLNDYYDESDSQLGAAVILRMMDRSALIANKELVILAQQNEVFWKKPFAEDDDLSWLSESSPS